MHNTIAILSISLPSFGGIMYMIGTYDRWALIQKMMEVMQ